MPDNATPDWHAVFRADLGFVRHTLLTDGELPTMIAAHTAGEIMLFPPNPRMAKDEFYDFVRVWVIAHDAQAVSEYGEAWMRAARPTDDVARMRATHRAEPMPSAAPERIEVVICMLTFREAPGKLTTLAAVALIERDAAGKVVGLGEFETGEGMELLAANLLPVDPPSATTRETAADLLKLAEEGGYAVMVRPPSPH